MTKAQYRELWLMVTYDIAIYDRRIGPGLVRHGWATEHARDGVTWFKVTDDGRTAFKSC